MMRKVCIFLNEVTRNEKMLNGTSTLFTSLESRQSMIAYHVTLRSTRVNVIHV